MLSLLLTTGTLKLQSQTTQQSVADSKEKELMYYFSTVPYYCDFENERESVFWNFKNTESGSGNAHWYVWGNENTYHYLMCGNGQDDYFPNDHPVTVLAERGIFLGQSNTLTVTFDITVGGEEGFDYCMVFLVPRDVEWEPATSGITDYIGSSSAWDLPYALHFGDGVAGTKLSNKNNETLTTTIPNPAPGQPYKLIFVWHNNNIDGNGQAVTIKNLRVTSEKTPTPISEIDITDFVTPVWGAHPYTNLETVSGNYSVSAATWYETTSNYSGSPMMPGDIFDNIDDYDYSIGAYYFMNIWVKLNDGCYFADNMATISINGDPQLIGNSNYNPQYMIALSDGSYKIQTKSFYVSTGRRYNITIGGMPVLSVNKDGITNPNITGTVTFDTITNTLTLNNATVNGKIKINDMTETYWINVENPSINLIGDNTISEEMDLMTQNASSHTGTITIKGNGKLSAKGIRLFPDINLNIKDCELAFSDPTYNWGTFGRGNNILTFNNVKATFEAKQSCIHNFEEINLTKCAITFPVNAVIAKPQSNLDYIVCEADGTTPAKNVVISRTNTGIEQSETETIKLYPNPASNIIYIDNAEGEWVKIYDNTGRVVKEELYNDGINIDGLSRGIYAVTINNHAVKFVKE